MTKKTLLALSASLMMGAAPAAAQTTPYGGYTGTEPLTSYGTRMMESYDVAVRLTVDENDQGLVGSQITGVRIPFPDDIDHLIEAQAWISKSLELTDYSFTPDVEVKSFTPGPGFIDVTFDSPYTITSEGVYVGYSFEMDEKVSKPITTISGTNPDYFYLHTTRSYYEGFSSVSADRNMMLAMQVLIDGLPARSVSPTLNDQYFKVGEGSNTLTFNIRNQGSQPVSSIDVAYNAPGESDNHVEKHITLDKALPAHYNASATVTLTADALPHAGDFPFTIQVTKVDSEGNQNALPSASTTIHSLSFVPTKRALLEEYTGTWCGWCPKGFVGLENMDALLGDDFVGVSYHNRDPMEFAGGDEGPEFPNGTASFPSAYIDRVHPTDPYSGDEPSTHFLLNETYAKACDQLAPADIDIAANYAEDNASEVECKATVRFPLPVQANPYQLGFILTADGLSGEEDSWTQKNYYPNNTEYTDTDMELFTQGDGYVYDLTYNMVAIGFSGPSFIEGSLPEQIEADKDYEYTFRFDLSKDSQTCKAKSILAGQQNYKLRAVALLIDSTTGEVVNARKAKVGGETDGVSALTVNKEATPVAYYTPDGRQLQSPTKGINIVRLADGRTVKMIVRK